LEREDFHFVFVKRVDQVSGIGSKMTEQQRAPFSEVPLGREARQIPEADLERADAIKGFTVEGGQAGAIPTTVYPQKRAFELGIIPVDREVRHLSTFSCQNLNSPLFI
jgi:hypothetical protein